MTAYPNPHRLHAGPKSSDLLPHGDGGDVVTKYGVI